jgi:hypothetical protein
MDRFRQTHAQTETVVVARCFTDLSFPHPPKPPSQTHRLTELIYMIQEHIQEEEEGIEL